MGKNLTPFFMIPYQNIAADCRASLDSEGSDYYLDVQDIIPAVNKAQDYLMSLILPKFGSKKFNEEVFKGIILTRIYQPSIYSRIILDQIIPTWGIISVVVNPVIAIPPAPSSVWTPSAVPSPAQSRLIPTYIYVSGGKSCRRLNSQEWNSNAGNPLLDGYVPVEANPLNLEYAYLSHIDNLSAIINSVPYEITIRPSINSSTPVAITYAKYPTRINSPTDNLDWSPVFQQLIVKATLKFIAEKQGDKTTIYTIQEQDIDTLIMNQS